MNSICIIFAAKLNFFFKIGSNWIEHLFTAISNFTFVYWFEIVLFECRNVWSFQFRSDTVRVSFWNKKNNHSSWMDRRLLANAINLFETTHEEKKKILKKTSKTTNAKITVINNLDESICNGIVPADNNWWLFTTKKQKQTKNEWGACASFASSSIVLRKHTNKNTKNETHDDIGLVEHARQLLRQESITNCRRRIIINSFLPQLLSFAFLFYFIFFNIRHDKIAVIVLR